MGKKKFDLEDRTLAFAEAVIKYINEVKKTLANVEIAKQVIRSSGSVGANYIEANEALSKKDFVYRIKLCRKEAKETGYWLKLLQGQDLNKKNELVQEADELTRIFGAILTKTVDS